MAEKHRQLTIDGKNIEHRSRNIDVFETSNIDAEH
jgi:hypothetical protein